MHLQRKTPAKGAGSNEGDEGSLTRSANRGNVGSPRQQTNDLPGPFRRRRRLSTECLWEVPGKVATHCSGRTAKRLQGLCLPLNLVTYASIILRFKRQREKATEHEVLQVPYDLPLLGIERHTEAHRHWTRSWATHALVGQTGHRKIDEQLLPAARKASGEGLRERNGTRPSERCGRSFSLPAERRMKK